MAVDWQSSAREMADRVDRINAEVQQQAASNTAASNSNSDNQRDSSYQLPSWMGNQYSQVPNTNWYSTNPSNPNATKYNQDGSPVATIGYSNQQTGQNFQGFGTPAQANVIAGLGNNPAALSDYMKNAMANNQLIPQSSVYTPSGGMPMSTSQVAAQNGPGSSGQNGVAYAPGREWKTDQLMPNAVGQAATPKMPNAYSNPLAPLTPGYMQSGSNAQTAAPAMPAMARWNVDAPYQDRLDRFKSNATDAQNEILSLKQMYDGANGNPARQAEISGWADQVRQAAGIKDSNATFGNNNGITPSQQQGYIDSYLKSISAGLGTGTGGTNGSTGGNPTGTIPDAAGTVKKDQVIPNAVGNGGTQLPGGGVAPSNNWSVTPAQAAQSAKEQAAARIQKILAGGKNAFDTGIASVQNSRDYNQKITQGNRALQTFNNSQRGDQYGGSAREDQFRLDRENNINDTFTNNNYDNQLASLSKTWQDLQAAAPEQQQALYDQLYHQAAQMGIQADQLNEQIKQNSINNNRNATNDASAATGYWNPSGMTSDQISQEVAKNSAAYANASPEQKQQLHERNVYLNGLLGKTDSTGSGDYVGGNPNGQVGYKTMARQTLDLNNEKDMAVLTGYMSDGKGGYVKTNAKQQQDLSNAWHESEQLGAVTRSLSALSGIPEGTQTQAAKNQASQIAISRANSNASINNMNADNTRADNAVKLTADQKVFAGNVAGELAQAKSKDDVLNFFNNPTNAKEMAKNLTQDQISKMKADALARYDKVTPSEKQDLTIKEKALASAQKDDRWKEDGADRNALIKEYEGYLK